MRVLPIGRAALYRDTGQLHTIAHVNFKAEATKQNTSADLMIRTGVSKVSLL
jgi:hypothetical protein